MSDKNEVKVLDHNYDGIQEYDHPLPMWWLVTFFATIIFGFHYWIHYEFGSAPTQLQELKADMDAVSSMRAQSPGGGETSEELNQLLASPDTLASGKQIYDSRCAVCHGPELQGSIGPNLVDNFWIHGKGQLTDIAQSVRKGYPEKGMPAWEAQISNDEVRQVTAFLGSRIGSTPPNPKAPQGIQVGN